MINIDKYLYFFDGLNFNTEQKRSIIKLINSLVDEIVQASITPPDNDDRTLDLYTFKISDKKEDNDVNLLLAADILFDKVVAVNVIGNLNGVDYNTIGTYHNGFITAAQDNLQVVFNVSFNTGKITIDKLFNLSEFMPHVKLEIGDTDEIKAYNLEHIKDGYFYVELDYGYGVGTFQPTTGGFIHITTAYGDETFFKVNIDGSIMADRDYLKPNEPYSIHLDSNQIGVPLDEITASKVYKAGELIIDGPTGLVTYTRTSDSIKSAVYFTDSKKDGSISVLTYTVNTKTITAA